MVHMLVVLRGCALWAAAAPVLGLSLFVTVARANGRMAAGHQLVVSPTDPSFFVMETTEAFSSATTVGQHLLERNPLIGYGDGGVQDPARSHSHPGVDPRWHSGRTCAFLRQTTGARGASRSRTLSSTSRSAETHPHLLGPDDEVRRARRCGRKPL